MIIIIKIIIHNDIINRNKLMNSICLKLGMKGMKLIKLCHSVYIKRIGQPNESNIN